MISKTVVFFYHPNRRGSLIIDHEIIANDTDDAAQHVATALKEALLGNKTITYDGEVAPVKDISYTGDTGETGSLINFDQYLFIYQPDRNTILSMGLHGPEFHFNRIHFSQVW